MTHRPAHRRCGASFHHSSLRPDYCYLSTSYVAIGAMSNNAPADGASSHNLGGAMEVALRTVVTCLPGLESSETTSLAVASADQELWHALLPLFTAGGAYDEYVGNPEALDEAIRSAEKKVGGPALRNYLKHPDLGLPICLAYSNAAFMASLSEYIAAPKQNVPGFMKVKAQCSDNDPISRAYRIMATAYRGAVSEKPGLSSAAKITIRDWFKANHSKEDVLKLAPLFLLKPPTDWVAVPNAAEVDVSIPPLLPPAGAAGAGTDANRRSAGRLLDPPIPDTASEAAASYGQYEDAVLGGRQRGCCLWTTS